MAELGGAVLSFAVSTLLDEVLVALQHLKNASKNLSKLHNLLGRLQQSVQQLCLSIQGENHPADKWLTEFHTQLEKSRDLVNNSGDIHRNIFRRYFTSKESLERYADIQALMQETSVHLWASGMSIQCIFSDADAKMLGDVRTVLARVEGVQKIADLSSKQSDILSEISKVEQAFDSEGSGESSSSSAVSIKPPRMDTIYNVPKPQVTFGGESVANELINHLLNEECGKWVGLWGMGGIGKTFTARKIFHDSTVRRHFSGGTFWLIVSKDQPSPNHLLKQLLKVISGRESVSKLPKNLEAAKLYLEGLLDRDRVLLVLDDVWQKDALEYLDVISERKKGVILVTTRDQGSLRDVINLVRIFEVPRLSPEDSWKLFSYHACRGRKGVVPAEVDAVARQMAEECQGLPLALEVIGSTMAEKELVPAEKSLGQTTLRVWERALAQLKDASHAKDEYEALYLKLQLSVESLSKQDSRLQDCFFYFAAFPEDDEISVNNLVRLWIAEGLVHGQDVNDVESSFSAEEEGRVLLGLLAAKSMIEVSDDGSECKIHDVLRDLVLRNLKWNVSKGEKIQAPARQCLYAPGSHRDKLPEDWIMSATPSSAKRLSLRRNDLKRFPEPEQFHAPHLQVLILSDNWELESLSPRFVQNLSQLRVLDLSSTGIKKIPGTLLRRLKSLVMLKLSLCEQLGEVSNEVDRLQSLKILDLFGCFRLRKLPRVNNLMKLEIYRASVPQEEAQMGASNGPITFQSCSPWQMRRGSSAGVVLYVLPPNLRQLHLKFGTSAKYHFDVSSLGFLKDLKLYGSTHRGGEATWMKSITLVQSHQLRYLSMIFALGKPAPSLSALFPLLQELSLALEHVDDGVESYGHEGAFPSLRRLDIYCEQSVKKMFVLHPGTMPKIESMSLWIHKKEHIPMPMEVLRTLKRLRLISFKFVIRDEDLESIFKHPDCFPHLKHVIIKQFSASPTSAKFPKHILDRQKQGFLRTDDDSFRI